MLQGYSRYLLLETLHFGADFPGLGNNDCVGDARRLRGIVHYGNFVRLTSGLGSKAVHLGPSRHSNFWSA